MFKEFKKFALKGNVMDLAIAVVIGAAFGKIITSFVNDIIMPVVGLLTGGLNFTNLNILIKEAQGDIPAVTLNYGNFIQTAVNFLIIALSIFFFIKLINNMKKKEAAALPVAPPKPSEEVVILQEIRDLLTKEK